MKRVGKKAKKGATARKSVPKKAILKRAIQRKTVLKKAVQRKAVLKAARARSVMRNPPVRAVAKRSSAPLPSPERKGERQPRKRTSQPNLPLAKAKQTGTPKPIVPPAVEKESQFPVMNDESEMLVGTLHEPARPSKTVVVIVHGFLGNRGQALHRELAVAIARSGVAAYRFDFSGNGDSEGRFEDAVPGKMLRELDIVVRKMRDRYARVILYGHSLGGLLSLLMAAREDPRIDAVASLAAPMHPAGFEHALLTQAQRDQLASVGFTIINVQRSVGDVPYTITDRFAQEMRALEPLAIAHRISCPVLIVHGSADETVPRSDSQELFEALPSKDIAIIGGADHYFRNPDHRDALLAVVVPWVKRQAR